LSFISFAYLAFLPVVLILYYALPLRARNPILLAASYFFYGCWNPVYALLMLFSTGITYFSGRMMTGASTTKRRTVLILCLAVNLAILVLFKYFDYFNDQMDRIFHLFGTHFYHLHPNFLLPVGISFYTFQALGYSMDVYRGMKPEKSFITYALFVSFFPQLVAGPIERSENMLPQLHARHHFSADQARLAILPLCWGYFKKMVIADRLAQVVNFAFDAPQSASGLQLLTATLAFALQIYCDFSAYSDIARGSAKLFSVDLMLNFDRPYFSRSVREFWRRWHISLSSWFKDYLYFPLGGSRVGKARCCLNLLIVFLVSGLWHGAANTYLVWGLLHGLFQVFGLLTKPFRQRSMAALHISENAVPTRIFQTAFTFLLVCFAWIFFRANRLEDAFLILGRLFSFAPGGGGAAEQLLAMGLTARRWLIVLAACLSLAAVDGFNIDGRISAFIVNRRAILYPVLFLLIAACLLFGVYGEGVDAQAFIYFQF
jgi:alginate O-acetyltransferase complex protein AlgI